MSEIIFTTEDGKAFAQFENAEELARKFVDVCVTADKEIELLTKHRAALLLAVRNAIDCNCLPPAVQMHLEMVAGFETANA